MLIKCFGSRGSIPVSGKEYIKYGGDTTCLEIRAKSGEIIAIDAGTGVRRLGNNLIKEGRNTVHFIFTHAHWDHITGFPFLKLLYQKSTNIIIHRCPVKGQYIEKMISKVLAQPNFPVKYSDLQATILYKEACPQKFEIGSVSVEPIPISHTNGGSGYKFTEDNKTFVFITDNELGITQRGVLQTKNYNKFSEGADLLIHDAEYTPKEYETYSEWGHSTYTDALDLAINAGVKQLGLFHLHQDRTDQEMDKIVDDCNKIIANKKQKLKCFGVTCEMKFEL